MDELVEILKKVIRSAEDVLYLASEDENLSEVWADELDKLELEIDFAHQWIIDHPR